MRNAFVHVFCEPVSNCLLIFCSFYGYHFQNSLGRTWSSASYGWQYILCLGIFKSSIGKTSLGGLCCSETRYPQIQWNFHPWKFPRLSQTEAQLTCSSGGSSPTSRLDYVSPIYMSPIYHMTDLSRRKHGSSAEPHTPLLTYSRRACTGQVLTQVSCQDLWKYSPEFSVLH